MSSTILLGISEKVFISCGREHDQNEKQPTLHLFSVLVIGASYSNPEVSENHFLCELFYY